MKCGEYTGPRAFANALTDWRTKFSKAYLVESNISNASILVRKLKGENIEAYLKEIEPIVTADTIDAIDNLLKPKTLKSLWDITTVKGVQGIVQCQCINIAL